ncbi:hypothetical protein DL770_002827 [Monosporascus sp. CRB-9-2]|nr:hypothetical protein DL770_002827 [Monosporascus sp. CRB-9-2]
MLAAEPLQLLIGACFATCVAADAGDDFSNNLFSDLAPLLALFGERVTTQFMSQSMGWADNIILAMAPLGVITAIVGAIRVGGPSWLKAIIGRARENRAVAESELMSSTSNEVCELWNGQEIVRVMGEGPIREFVILLPKGIKKNGDRGSKATTPSQPTTTSREGSSSVGGQMANPKISQDVLVMKLDKESDAKSDGESDTWKEYLEAYHPATIREHIFGPQQRQDPSETEKGSGRRKVREEPTVQGNNSGDRIQQEQDLEKALSRPHTREVRDDSNSENPDESRLPIAVIRNTTAHTPNLALNVHNQVGRGELYVVAAFGIVLQLGVLVYCGFATYYPTLMFLKDGNPVAEYSFPCTAAGTLLLVAGMLACSYVVESSTSETRYCPVAGREARVIWLQRSGIVNDQAFKSFAIFPSSAQALVTTSQRLKDPGEEDSGQEDPGQEDPGQEDPVQEDPVQEIVAVTATMISICGFIVQFTGLRGMHWSASVAQLGATVLMTVLRAWVRRNLAGNPKALPLVSGHELDWLAMTLGKPTNAPWLHPLEDYRKWHKYRRPWAGPRTGKDRSPSADNEPNSLAGNDRNDWDWRIAAVDNPEKCEKLKSPQTSGTDTPASREAVQRAENGAHPTPLGQPEELDARSTAHRVMRIRRDLGELADWHGPASAEAIALARAIEVTMDAIFGTALNGTFTWSLSALKSSKGSGRESIAFRLERGQNGNWKAYSDEIEAALSLWLYSVDKRENGQQAEDNGEANGSEKQQTGKNGTLCTKPLRSGGDAWLRAKGTPAKPSLRLLGSHATALLRDLQWWTPGGAAKVIELDAKSKSDNNIIEVESHRVIGFTPEVKSDPSTNIDIYQYKRKSPEYPCEHAPCESGPLAVESYIPLKTLYAQHMFSAFVWATTKTMDSPISDGADIQPTKPDGASSRPTWQSFTLHNARLSQMAENIQSTGLGSLEDVYLCIIPPLSTEKKLPRADAIIEWAREHAKPHEQLGHWKEAADAYLWLFRTAKTFPGQDDITVKATAILMEYLRAVTDAIELREAQQFGEDIPELKQLKEKLEKELQDGGVSILAALMGLYETQSRSWECCLVKKPKPLEDEDMMLKFTRLHGMAHGGKGWAIKEWMRSNSAGLNEKDILDWTPLHYAAAKPSRGALEELLAYRADINARDIRGRTPLHYACQRNNASIVQSLLRKGAEINMRDVDGRTPLHNTAIHSRSGAMQSLIEAGADIDVVDNLGRTPLIWAAYKGRKATVKLLEDANIKLRDYNGRTALHLVALAEADTAMEGEEVVRALIGKKADKEAKDRQSCTPLHLAASKGYEPIVKYLIEEGADKEAKDTRSRTPLHLAASKGHEPIVKYLIEEGADKEAKDTGSWTPLHLAAWNGYEPVVKCLIEQGADKEAKTNSAETPLSLAANGGYESVVKCLVEQGANKEGKTQSGRTPLHLAASEGHEPVVKYLVEQGVNKEAKDKNRRTPLHHAARNGHKLVVKCLVEQGADKEGKTQSGWTPLHLAAWNGYEPVTKYLIEQGADKEAKDNSGWKPLYYVKNGSYKTDV